MAGPTHPHPAHGTTRRTTHRIDDVALIFEGGGTRAAYTSAFVVTLLEAGLDFQWVAGISAGASNTANYLSRDARRARRSFVDFTADENFGDLRTWMRGQGLFNAEYIYQRSGGADQALPFDWRTFTENSADFRVIAFDADSGEDRVWDRTDVAETDDLMIRVRASSTMPVLMPPVTIGGRTYVDGALGSDGGIALTQAQGEGYERFVVVLTQERSYLKTPQRFPAFFRRHFRRHPAVADALLTRWKRYNATRERLFELERAGMAHVFAPERMTLSNSNRNLSQLAAAHRAGLSQSLRELPALREFLGL